MATMKDVARDAGVALGTVSKVVNGQYVSEKNRLKVEQSIKKLNYQVDVYARGLKISSTRLIAVIVPDILNPFFTQWVYELEKIIVQRGYKMIFFQTLHDEEKEGQCFQMAAQNKVDGIVGITYNDTDKYLSGNFPFVSLDRHFDTTVCCVASDNAAGGSMAAKKMIETGSNKLLYIRNGSNIYSEVQKRETAFIETCRRMGKKVETHDFGDQLSILGEEQEMFCEQVWNFVASCIRENKFKFDGIFASTDLLAEIVCVQLRKLGVRIPEDVQVIGYDGIRCMNGNKYRVSTIVQPIQQMAEGSIDLLLKQIQKKSVPELTLYPVQFSNGGTTREF